MLQLSGAWHLTKTVPDLDGQKAGGIPAGTGRVSVPQFPHVFRVLMLFLSPLASNSHSSVLGHVKLGAALLAGAAAVHATMLGHIQVLGQHTPA